MVTNNVLDAALVKDLSNHIYEKRKATAYQIETITKQALARDDSQTIFRIIVELTELTYHGTNSAKMGAITALGSVSVALGSFAIAYFLKDIVTPIFATFKDTDARLRYYASESLYNIAKIARGEILLYFNEVFDVLCILVTDTESSVKNAADILDRLIKDIVSEKATNYFSILHQEDFTDEIQSHFVDANGDAIQVNIAQDSKKAFSLPKFIPTLLERMYVLDPFAKQFLIGWLELFDDIPAMEIVTFLPNLLSPLIKFLMNDCPSDVRSKTNGILKIFLREVEIIHLSKVAARRKNLLKDREHAAVGVVAISNTNPTTTSIADTAFAVAHTEPSPSSPLPPAPPSPLPTTPRKDERKENVLSIKSPLKAEADLKPDLPELDNLSIMSNSTTIIKRGDFAESHPPRSDARNNSILEETVLDEGFVDGQNIFIDFGKIIEILLSFLRQLPSAVANNTFNTTANTSMNTTATSLAAAVDANDLTKQPHDIYLEVKSVALKWLEKLIEINALSFVSFLPECVFVIIQNISQADQDKDRELQKELMKFNSSLQNVVGKLRECHKVATQLRQQQQQPSAAELDTRKEFEALGLTSEVYDEFVEVQLVPLVNGILRTYQVGSVNEISRIALLDWLIYMYSADTQTFFNLSQEKGCSLSLADLVNSCAEASNDVILKILELLAVLSKSNQDFFRNFIVQYVALLKRDRGNSGEQRQQQQLQQQQQQSQPDAPVPSREKVEFTIRKLCVSLSSERIFCTISEVLSTLEDCEFADRMVVMLNTILLTAPEVADLRKRLRDLDQSKLEDFQLFSTLFLSWCNNVPSALSLCLLTCNYELAYIIIKRTCELEISFDFLSQIDILVQLLELPIFLKLRLQLLEPERNPFLCKTLYGLLMILPQSTTFTTLKNRLWLVSMLFPPPIVSASSLLLLQVLGSALNMPLASLSVSPVSTSTPGTLSLKRRRILEMAEKLSLQQEKNAKQSCDETNGDVRA